MNITPASLAKDTVPLQRADGELRIGFRRRGAATALASLYQSGCAKARFPRVDGGACQAVLINTAGGLTDGDFLENAVEWENGSCAAVTTQACERIYRSRLAPARIRTRLGVGEDAHAFWLPQETILFNAGRLERTMDVRLAGSARFTGCESVILGRPAMGERVETGAIRDFWRIERGGNLLFVDRFAMDGPLNDELARAAIGNGATAWATLVHAGPDAQTVCGRVRELFDRFDIEAGCTDLGEFMVARLLAADGFRLRKVMVALLELLCGAGNVPRNWTC